MTRAVVLVAAFMTCVCLWSAGNAKRGEELFNKMCTGCHGLDSAKEGPALRGVYGRRSGSVVYDQATLDRWLSDPTTVKPEADMAFRLENAAQRADIIAYLKSLPPK
jgi:cytochrome c